MEYPTLSKSFVANAFHISRASLYLPQKQKNRDQCLLEEILRVMNTHPEYGHRPIAYCLGRNKETIRRIMKKYGLSHKKKKRWKKPKDQGIPNSSIPNRLGRSLAWLPHLVWVGDFTEWSWHGIKIYLASVMDQHTRLIVGWAIGRHHTAQLVMDAMEDARHRYEAKTPNIYHSDQGSEYRSSLFRAWLMSHRILPSHSKKASPWQNGYKESFYGRFKSTFNIYEYERLEDVLEAMHHRIHYYNTKRIHTSLKMTPQAYYDLRIKFMQDQGIQFPPKFKDSGV